MTDYLPHYYRESPITQNLLDREADELASLNSAIFGIIEQWFVETATWGLPAWERVLGIVTDPLKPLDQRRSVIKSKLRGTGTITVELIQNVAESYANGTVQIIEDYPHYTVTIKFISTRGIPANLEDIRNALREIIPAHLAVVFEFTYLTWSELDSEGLSWDTFDTLGLTWNELEVYRAN